MYNTDFDVTLDSPCFPTLVSDLMTCTPFYVCMHTHRESLISLEIQFAYWTLYFKNTSFYSFVEGKNALTQAVLTQAVCSESYLRSSEGLTRVM